MKLVLHNYWRSSASHRVRIGLGLKQLAYDYVHIGLAGKQKSDDYTVMNPMQQVPTLEIIEDDGTHLLLTQSLPILEYLEERWPEHPILPRDPYLRARSRALAEIINSGVQPLQNLSTTNRVKELGGDDAAWTRHFIEKGLHAFAALATGTAGQFSIGDAPTIADCALVPQLASARRFNADISKLALLTTIEARCLAMPAFAAAAPDKQPDAKA
jgi:maleylpyruvate isomerase